MTSTTTAQPTDLEALTLELLRSHLGDAVAIYEHAPHGVTLPTPEAFPTIRAREDISSRRFTRGGSIPRPLAEGETSGRVDVVTYTQDPDGVGKSLPGVGFGSNGRIANWHSPQGSILEGEGMDIGMSTFAGLTASVVRYDLERVALAVPDLVFEGTQLEDKINSYAYRKGQVAGLDTPPWRVVDGSARSRRTNDEGVVTVVTEGTLEFGRQDEAAKAQRARAGIVADPRNVGPVDVFGSGRTDGVLGDNLAQMIDRYIPGVGRVISASVTGTRFTITTRHREPQAA